MSACAFEGGEQSDAPIDDIQSEQTGADAAEKGKRPPPGGGGRTKDPRLGSTSILMGSVEIPDIANTCGDAPSYSRLLCLTDMLKSGASEDLLALMQLDYSVEQAQNWSNLPAGAFPKRPGAFLGEFSSEQLGLVKAILMEAASLTANEGFDEMVQTLNADDYI